MKRRSIIIHETIPDRTQDLSPRQQHKACWDNILNAGTGVRPGHADEYLNVICSEGDRDRDREGQRREEQSVDRPRVGGFPFQEDLEVVPQCDGDYGKAGAEREDGKESEEILDEGDVRDRVETAVTPVRLEVKGVEVVEVVETEYSGERQKTVENQDKRVVAGKESVDGRLVSDRGHHLRKGMVTHERVDAYTKQIWNAL